MFELSALYTDILAKFAFAASFEARVVLLA